MQRTRTQCVSDMDGSKYDLAGHTSCAVPYALCIRKLGVSDAKELHQNRLP